MTTACSAVISLKSKAGLLPFAAMYAPRFAVVTAEAPLPLGRFRLNAIAPKAAMMDAGLAWFFNVLARTEPEPGDNKRSRSRNRR